MAIKTTIIILTVIAIVFFLVGGVCGFLFEKQRIAPNLGELQKIANAVNILSSEKSFSITTAGKISSISGRIITIATNSGNADVYIGSDAQIFIFATSASAAKNGYSPARGEFGDLKVGDNIIAGLKIMPDGQLGGVSITIQK